MRLRPVGDAQSAHSDHRAALVRIQCRPLGLAAGDDTVGQCFPEPLGAVGDPCETGTLKPDADPKKDKDKDTIQGAREMAAMQAVRPHLF